MRTRILGITIALTASLWCVPATPAAALRPEVDYQRAIVKATKPA